MMRLLLVLSESSAIPFSHPYTLLLILSLAFCTHAFRIFIHLAGWRCLSWKELVPRVIAACMIMAVVYALCVPLIIPPAMVARSQDPVNIAWSLGKLALGIFSFLLTWSGVYFGFHLVNDYQRMQINHLRLRAALREAEHRALSAQVNPHFLFNSLNTLRSLIVENPEKAREAVSDLARVFRCSLKTSHEDLITLREEMEMVNSYLSLEKARFESRLVIHDNIPEQALEAMLPPFLLQILIENAIKYGKSPQPFLEIAYSASISDQGLILRVTNPGRISEPGGGFTTGIGLNNSRLRLKLLFGSRAFLSLTDSRENTVIAEALIPQLNAA